MKKTLLLTLAIVAFGCSDGSADIPDGASLDNPSKPANRVDLPNGAPTPANGGGAATEEEGKRMYQEALKHGKP